MSAADCVRAVSGLPVNGLVRPPLAAPPAVRAGDLGPAYALVRLHDAQVCVWGGRGIVLPQARSHASACPLPLSRVRAPQLTGVFGISPASFSSQHVPPEWADRCAGVACERGGCGILRTLSFLPPPPQVSVQPRRVRAAPRRAARLQAGRAAALPPRSAGHGHGGVRSGAGAARGGRDGGRPAPVGRGGRGRRGRVGGGRRDRAA